ncbi:MAG: hypothetical protein ACHRXM_40420 [Isosphaerales bacterium]
MFTYKKERPIVHPIPAETERHIRREYTYFGRLGLPSNIYHGHGAPPGELVPWLEESADYLDRLGLLLPAEREALEQRALEADDDESDTLAALCGGDFLNPEPERRL